MALFWILRIAHVGSDPCANTGLAQPLMATHPVGVVTGILLVFGGCHKRLRMAKDCSRGEIAQAYDALVQFLSVFLYWIYGLLKIFLDDLSWASVRYLP